ncbi:hypothetical protein LX97_00070 [Nonlabens dokdonensis]|uniref:Uncharacterized protein n=2 Tax=Nonlabens dokdonensis TaxID=328515 RepID=L7W5K9_NONDD|nr:hypothetical protein [Nonlabens dokdonensis]AGC75369.1 hypothetical protein DDD_0242 [Nonlabens dokdonensis DSW-6]PZX43071.1 hypothetical protein LX97_00070 [Nonlabens dokdonensis]
MTEKEVLKIANDHINLINKENPYADKMNYILTEAKEYLSGFYFDYEFELKNNEENLMFGGAPGFLVTKDSGKVIDLSWSELNKLIK